MQTAFYHKWLDLGANNFDFHGWQLALHFGDGPSEHLQVRQVGGVYDRGYAGIVRIAGADAKDFLDRMSTVPVKQMQDHHAVNGMLLSAQGKIISMFRLLTLGDDCLLITQVNLAAASIKHLEKYHISEDLSFSDETGQWAMLEFHGTNLATEFEYAVDGNQVTTLNVGGADTLLFATQRCGGQGLVFMCPTTQAEELWQALAMDERVTRLKPFGLDAENTLRFDAGCLNVGMELDDSIIPLVAKLDEWVPQNQGCYLGQEVIERIRSSGHFPKIIVGFELDGFEMVAPGTPIEFDGATVGVLVNSMYIPSREKIMAVGYVKRQALESEQPLSIAGINSKQCPWPFPIT